MGGNALKAACLVESVPSHAHILRPYTHLQPSTYVTSHRISIYIYLYLPIYLLIYLSIYLSSFDLSVHLCIYIYTYMNIYQGKGSTERNLFGRVGAVLQRRVDELLQLVRLQGALRTSIHLH